MRRNIADYIIHLSLLLSIILYGCGSMRSFSFVQITDPQLGFGGYVHDMNALEQAVKQINELKPDFVIICGDMVDRPNDTSYADFQKIREQLDVRSYCIPGNHDIKNEPDEKSLNYYRKIMGDDYYSFRHKGFLFIFTNTQLWKTYVNGESDLHDAWFTKTISQGNNSLPVFVIGHYPLYLSKPEEKSKYFNIPPEKRVDILNLFEKHNVVAYLSGHAHKRVINEYNGIQMVSAESTSKNFDNSPLGIRLWHISKDSVSQEFIPLH